MELKFGEWALRTFGGECVPLRDFVCPTHHTKGVDTDRRGLFTLSKTSTVSLQASIASLQAPAGTVHSEASIPVATPPLQPAISPTPSTTSRETQSVVMKKAKSRSVPPPDPNLTPLLNESTSSLHVPMLANTSVAQNAIKPSQPRAVSETPSDMATPSDHRITPALPRSTTNAPPVPATKSVLGYRTRGPASVAPSHQGSIDGVPEIGLDLPAIIGAPLQDSVTDDTSETIVDLSDFISFSSDIDGESHVSSSQKTLDGCCNLSPPPSSQSRSSSPAVKTPWVDPPDFPSWMTNNGQWKHVASTHGGPAWERLLEVYVQQERRLEFRETVGFTYTSPTNWS